MLRLLALILTWNLLPYWQVPRLASYATISTEMGHITLTCPQCGHIIKTFETTPTVKQMVKAAKKHKCQN